MEASRAQIKKLMALRRAARAMEHVQEVDYGASLHPGQLAVFEDESRVRAVLTGRRWGKSWLIAAFLTQCSYANAAADIACPYIACTSKNARHFFWPVLKAYHRRTGLDYPRECYNETHLICTPPGGARIMLGGCDDRAQVELWRGGKFGGVAIDECGAFGPWLRDLYTTIRPGCADTRAPILLAGNPGIVWDGFWYSITGPQRASKIPMYTGTMFDNPRLLEGAGITADALAKEVLEENGWSPDHPTYIREYLGRWVQDVGDLVYPFTAERNGVSELPEVYDSGRWRYVIAVDPGYVDAMGIVVLAAHTELRDHFVLSSELHEGWLPEQLASRISELMVEYPDADVVMDAGGLGKPYAAECSRRLGVGVRAAEKRERASAIRWTHDLIAAGRVKVLAGPQNDALRSEWAVLMWDEHRLDHAPAQRDPKYGTKRDHCADAARYGFRHLYHYAWDPHVEKPAPGTAAYYEQQEKAIIQRFEREAVGDGDEWPAWDR